MVVAAQFQGTSDCGISIRAPMRAPFRDSDRESQGPKAASGWMSESRGLIPTPKWMKAGVPYLVFDTQERDSKIRRFTGRAGAHGAGLEVLLVKFPAAVVVDRVEEQDLTSVAGGLEFALVE